MNEIWWDFIDCELDFVPTFHDMGFTPISLGMSGRFSEWHCAREQLWAIREGLA